MKFNKMLKQAQQIEEIKVNKPELNFVEVTKAYEEANHDDLIDALLFAGNAGINGVEPSTFEPVNTVDESLDNPLNLNSIPTQEEMVEFVKNHLVAVTSYNAINTNVGDVNYIQTIKLLREYFGPNAFISYKIGLKEAKDIVDGVLKNAAQLNYTYKFTDGTKFKLMSNLDNINQLYYHCAGRWGLWGWYPAVQLNLADTIKVYNEKFGPVQVKPMKMEDSLSKAIKAVEVEVGKWGETLPTVTQPKPKVIKIKGDVTAAVEDYLKSVNFKQWALKSCVTWVKVNYNFQNPVTPVKIKEWVGEVYPTLSLKSVNLQVGAVSIPQSSYNKPYVPSHVAKAKQFKPSYFYHKFDIDELVEPEATTQKEKGCRILRKKFPNDTVEHWSTPEQVWGDIENNGYLFHKEVFARPCPKTPRHGFVDSRIINNRKEYDALLAETRKADHEGTILLMPLIKARSSSVWTPGLLSVGEGNDGATAGKAGCVAFPIAPGKMDDNILKAAAIKDSPYVEVVYGRSANVDKAWLTQLRDGPEIPAGHQDTFKPASLIKDFDANAYGEGYEVKEIVEVVDETQYDLLAWEAKVATFKPGFVVYFPGGTLSSHIAVHPHQHKPPYPVITTYKPKLGDYLYPVKGFEVIGTPLERAEQILNGYRVGITYPYDNDSSEIVRDGLPTIKQATFPKMVMSLLHNGMWLFNKHPFMLGVCSGLAVRVGAALCLAEMRYYSKVSSSNTHSKARNQIYEEVLKDASLIWETLRCAESVYFDKNVWGGSFGGPKWGECAKATRLIHEQITKLHAVIELGIVTEQHLLTPLEAKLIDALNNQVNQCHNGGKFFTKLVSNSKLDQIATKPEWEAMRLGWLWFEFWKLRNQEVQKSSKMIVMQIHGITA